jgi:hypothetical protein
MLSLSLSEPPSGEPLANLDRLEVDLKLGRVGLFAGRAREVWPGLQVPGMDEQGTCWFRPNASLEVPLRGNARSLIFLPGLAGQRIAADVLYLLHSMELRSAEVLP